MLWKSFQREFESFFVLSKGEPTDAEPIVVPYSILWTYLSLAPFKQSGTAIFSVTVYVEKVTAHCYGNLL